MHNIVPTVKIRSAVQIADKYDMNSRIHAQSSVLIIPQIRQCEGNDTSVENYNGFETYRAYAVLIQVCNTYSYTISNKSALAY